MNANSLCWLTAFQALAVYITEAACSRPRLTLVSPGAPQASHLWLLSADTACGAGGREGGRAAAAPLSPQSTQTWSRLHSPQAHSCERSANRSRSCRTLGLGGRGGVFYSSKCYTAASDARCKFTSLTATFMGNMTCRDVSLIAKLACVHQTVPVNWSLSDCRSLALCAGTGCWCSSLPISAVCLTHPLILFPLACT